MPLNWPEADITDAGRPDIDDSGGVFVLVGTPAPARDAELAAFIAAPVGVPGVLFIKDAASAASCCSCSS